MATLTSINIGRPRITPGGTQQTGIYKEAVSGPVAIGREGIADDAILNRRHHGVVYQSLYCYFGADYEWWAEHSDIVPSPGLFGENLTIAGSSSANTAIGDRFVIGEVELEVTYHRTPCQTFAAKMGDPRWVKRFHQAQRPGAYVRVLSPGSIAAGMEVQMVPYTGERITVSELMSYDVVKELPIEFMRRAITTPIREKTRFKYETRLSSLF